MNLRLAARYRVCTLKIGKALGFSSVLVRALISTFLSNYFFNVIYFPLLGYCLLVNYMSENDFFSYELISDSFFAVNLFVVAMVAGLMVTMFALFSSGVLFYANKKGHNVPLRSYWPLTVVNILFIVFIGYLIYSAKEKMFPIFVVIVCAYMATHYAVFLFGKLKTKVLSLFALLVLSIGFVFTQPALTANLFGNGLRVFGVGGYTPVLISDETREDPYEAKLLLVTPSILFFKENEKTGFVPIDKINKVIRK